MRTGLILAVIGLLPIGCGVRKTTYVYPFQPPIADTGGHPLTIKERDWRACDGRGDYEATAELEAPRNALAGAMGGLGGAIGGAIAGGIIATGDHTQSEKETIQRHQTYESIVRQYLSKRGYAIVAPPVVDRGVEASKP
jgi:hypothetical protein